MIYIINDSLYNEHEPYTCIPEIFGDPLTVVSHFNVIEYWYHKSRILSGTVFLL